MKHIWPKDDAMILIYYTFQKFPPDYVRKFLALNLPLCACSLASQRTRALEKLAPWWATCQPRQQRRGAVSWLHPWHCYWRRSERTLPLICHSLCNILRIHLRILLHEFYSPLSASRPSRYVSMSPPSGWSGFVSSSQGCPYDGLTLHGNCERKCWYILSYLSDYRNIPTWSSILMVEATLEQEFCGWSR